MQRISLDRVRRARVLFGVLLLLIGIGFWFNTARHGFTDNPLPYLLIPAALLLIAYRNYIEIDPRRARLAHRVGFGYAYPVARFSTDGLRRITLREVIKVSKKGNESSTYTLQVGGAAGGKLCSHGVLWIARSVAERIARALRIELETRMFKDSNVRAPDTLDMPLAERWRRAGVIKMAPVPGAESRVTISHDAESSEFSAPVEPMPRIAIGIGSVALLALLFWLNSIDAAPLLMLIIFVPAIVFFGGGFIAQHSGRNRLRFTPTLVEFRRGYLPFRPNMPLADIEEMFLSHDEIVFMGDRKYVLIDRPSDAADRSLQLQFIKRQLSQRQTGSSTNPD